MWKKWRISVLREVLYPYMYYSDMMYHKWQRYSSLQTRFLTSINHEFQKSWITDFPQWCKTVSLLRYIVNKENIKKMNSRKQKKGHHRNSSVPLLRYYKVFKINTDTQSDNRFFFSGWYCIKAPINQDFLVK